MNLGAALDYKSNLHQAIIEVLNSSDWDIVQDILKNLKNSTAPLYGRDLFQQITDYEHKHILAFTLNQHAKKTINTRKSDLRQELFIAVDMQNTVITCQLITIKSKSPPIQHFVHKQFVLQTTELNKLIPCFQQNDNVNIIITNNPIISNKAKNNPQDFKYFTSSSFSSDSDTDNEPDNEPDNIYFIANLFETLDTTPTISTTFKCKITETTVHIDLTKAIISKLEQPQHTAAITFDSIDLFDSTPHFLKQDPDIFRVLNIQNTPPNSPTQTKTNPHNSSTKKKGRKPGPWFQFWINNVQGSSLQHYESLDTAQRIALKKEVEHIMTQQQQQQQQTQQQQQQNTLTLVTTSLTKSTKSLKPKGKGRKPGPWYDYWIQNVEGSSHEQ